MNVEIKNGDAFCAGRQCFERGDGDVVQIAKAHGFFARGVMAGRAHEAENIFAGARNFHGVKRGGDGSAGVVGNVFKERRVGVEVLRDFQPREHFGRVGAEDLSVAGFAPARPIDWQFSLIFQPLDCGGDARGTFGMAVARIAGAFFVGDDFHSVRRVSLPESGSKISPSFFLDDFGAKCDNLNQSL